jgi:hypothetical protein
MEIQSGITKKIVILKYFKMHIIACQVILNINQLKKCWGVTILVVVKNF